MPRRWTPTAPILAVVLLSFIALAGTTGYMIIEGWSVWDSFYMTIISRPAGGGTATS